MLPRVLSFSTPGRFAGTALIAALLVVRPTHAESSAHDSKTSLSRYREAYRAIERKEWREARAILLELWPKTRTYDVAASLGQVEFQLQNYASAARYIAFAIEHVAPKERAENLERYQAALEELRTHIASVRVSVSEPDAEILVNSESVGKAPLNSELFLDPGNYVIEARAADRGISRQVNVERGRAYVFELVLPATVTVPEATHDTRLESAPIGGPPTEALRQAPVQPRESFEPRRSQVPLWIGAGVMAVGVTGAVAFGIAARGAQDEVRTLRSRLGPSGCSSGSASASDCRAAEDAVERQRRNATLSTISIGVGAAGALGTLGYWLFWPEPQTRSALHFEPVFGFGRTHASVALEGDF